MVKEEWGNKGVVLIIYLLFVGCYCVLMLNIGRGGGILRKIINGMDCKWLCKIVDVMEVLEGMGFIICIVGLKCIKMEIKCDYEYLLWIWENVCILIFEFIVLIFVYEEGSFVKCVIRDLYNKDISEVFVEGEDFYKEVKGFMWFLMLSYVKNVK